MGYKLSISQRTHDRTGWNQTSQFQVAEIQAIKVEGAAGNKALNAIPSPLARMHLFESAFQMVYQDIVNHTDLAGDTYRKLVSDCFDVFELLYYFDTHLLDQKPLQLTIWEREQELETLQQSQRDSHRLLGRTLEMYLDTGIAFERFPECLIIKYGDRVIAGSSPFTGFFTTPDDLTDLGLLKPLSQLTYFSRITPFRDRPVEIRRYIYNFFEQNEFLREAQATRAIRELLALYDKDLEMPAGVKHQPLIQIQPAKKLFGKPLETAKGIGAHLFEPKLVRINLALNEESFYRPAGFTHADGLYDYLLPLSLSFFEQYEVSKIPAMVNLREIDKDTVDVTIKLDSGKTLSKKYAIRPVYEQDGQIIDLYGVHQISFNLGIFPFLRVQGQPSGSAGYNDFYRVVTMMEDGYFKHGNTDFDCQFGRKGEILESADQVSIIRNDRTPVSKKTFVGSTYYSLNIDFDFIRVRFPSPGDHSPLYAVIAPKWKESVVGDKKLDFSVDLGTTSTFIAWSDDPKHKEAPRPFGFMETEMPVMLLNRPKGKNKGEMSATEFYERSMSQFILSIDIQKQEFIPGVIRKNEKYGLPIRTVMYEQLAVPAGKKQVLSNANISFVYQKPNANIATLEFDNQEYKANIKWDLETVTAFNGSVSLFIEELLVLIRTKILLSQGDPALSRICWFYPLSFSDALRQSYRTVWNKCAQDLMKKTDNVICLTESEAPFYYLFGKSAINNAHSVVTVDIGGGSTDIMAFSNGTPVFGSSFYFGANILWGNGYAFANGKTNGIYQAVRQEVTERLKPTLLKKQNDDYCAESNTTIGSDEIINFWIANQADTGILNSLQKPDFKLSYLIHLSAIAYYTLKLMRRKKQPAPTGVLFSGNGSKYIDLIHDAQTIGRVWQYFAGRLYGPGVKTPQVILPGTDRKEATCYGALLTDFKEKSIDSVKYIGFEEEQDRREYNYGMIEVDRRKVVPGVMDTCKEFIEWFFAMNDEKGLNFRTHFGIQTRLKPIRSFMLEKVEENFNEGYLKRKGNAASDDLVSDAFFFYPFVGLIYKINNLTPRDIENLGRKSIFYAASPDGECEFSAARLTPEQKPDSIFELIVDDERPEHGELAIIDNADVHRRAVFAYQSYLDPVSTYPVHPISDQMIRTVAPGKISRRGDSWIVDEKIQIEFN